MVENDGARAAVADPCLLLGQVAQLLAEDGSLGAALTVVADGLQLRTAVVRDAAGTLLAATEPVRSDPDAAAAAAPSVEIPLHGRSGSRTGTLTVTGARPQALPVLRSAAAVFGLALHPRVDDVEADRDRLADALHDGPVQSLVVARYASDAAVRGGDATAARDAVQAALVDLRRFLWQLRPRGGTGLVEALDQLSSHLVEAGGPPVGLVGDVDAAAALKGEAGVLAFRLVQAVARPDGAAVRVALRTDRSRLVVDIDGGIPLTLPEQWLRRAHALGGHLTTTRGRVRLVVPHPEARSLP